MIRAGLAFIALLSAGACASAASAPDFAGHASLHLPEGVEGPVPAVVLLSGCGGVRDVQDDYARAANAQGWAALIVDSHAARGIGRTGSRLLVCTGLRMRGQARADDVFAALDLLRADARIDASALALAGWSHGGWTVLDAMASAEAGERGEGAFEGVRGAFVVYPYCGAIIRARRDPVGAAFPVQPLLAGRDLIASARDCERLFTRQRSKGALIRPSILFDQATHAFDAEDQPWDPRMRYDADEAAEAHALFRRFLRGLEP
ncbi:prolyl oligopeptidase family serine peptidase [Alkalicaulis satelles]|uniref:Prolyl oligopeptidase family serine peptidase n=1 Tax=Alkalicaulis satelles TaxID=2609175 RepID=A0A5M6ZCF9_9PROT|nr:dienelactone hydrolase family protein [Alkalicaulis satelles]KAA5802423.1 prolyl oligopeptidase family serine peptidase [Alkalicaulis satelles]